jgi:hypothetical protein
MIVTLAPSPSHLFAMGPSLSHGGEKARLAPCVPSPLAGEGQGEGAGA